MVPWLRSLLPTLRSLTTAALPAEVPLLTPRQRVLLLPLFVPTALGGFAMLTVALRELASTLSPPQVLGLAGLVLAASLAEVFPVPIGRATVGGVSLAALFILGAGLLHGWAASAIVAFCTSLIAQVKERKEVIRLVYNAAVYALAGGLAGLAMHAVGGSQSVGTLVLSALVGSLAFWAVNISLVVSAVSRVTRQKIGTLARSVAVEAWLPAAVMASITVMLVSLAESSVFLPLTLVGPLVAITLYQRTIYSSHSAMKLALTDSLTDLGNYRHFCQKLDEYEEAARKPGLVLSLVLFDVDDFKSINDTHGHLSGDAALRGVAAALRQDAEAFRIGGDEFAVLLNGSTEAEARAIAMRIMATVARTSFDDSVSLELSAGIVSYPGAKIHIGDLVACADIALYAAKNAGKNRIFCYRPGSPIPDHGRGGRGTGVGPSRTPARTERARAA